MVAPLTRTIGYAGDHSILRERALAGLGPALPSGRDWVGVVTAAGQIGK